MLAAGQFDQFHRFGSFLAPGDENLQSLGLERSESRSRRRCRLGASGECLQLAPQLGDNLLTHSAPDRRQRHQSLLVGVFYRRGDSSYRNAQRAQTLLYSYPLYAYVLCEKVPLAQIEEAQARADNWLAGADAPNIRRP